MNHLISDGRGNLHLHGVMNAIITGVFIGILKIVDRALQYIMINSVLAEMPQRPKPFQMFQLSMAPISQACIIHERRCES